MTRIHGIAYIVLGAVVSIFSFWIKGLRFFLIFGIGFFVFGMIRILIDNSREPKKTQRPKTPPQAVAHKFCSSCSATVHNFQNFCHNCGQRLIK